MWLSHNVQEQLDVHQTCVTVCTQKTTTANTRSKRKNRSKKNIVDSLHQRKLYIKYQKYIYTCKSKVIEDTFNLLPGSS